MQNLHNIIISSGPVTLQGSVEISGSKNASLPLLAASLLCDGPVNFSNIPTLSDIGIFVALLTSLGSYVEWVNKGIRIAHHQTSSLALSPALANKIRGSVLLLGPLIARYGKVQLPMPGGCPIGKRPIDFHLMALEQLGARFYNTPQGVCGEAPSGLRGATIRFPKPTVTGTENLIMAACLATGTTQLENCAHDPEVDELIRFLVSAGANIQREDDRIIIEGSQSLLKAPSNFSIVADRMEAGSFIAACGMTQGSIELIYDQCPGLEPVLDHVTAMGMSLSQSSKGLSVKSNQRLKARSFTTLPHPGFPTDLQAPFMALNCVSEGCSVIEEQIWENRFFHAEEFLKLGATLSIVGNQVHISGTRNLKANIVSAQDLRGSCALLLMALVAQGETILLNNHHLDRGYEFIVNKLNALGANIRREYCSDQELEHYRMHTACLVA